MHQLLLPTGIIIFVYCKIFSNTRQRLRKRAEASNLNALRNKNPAPGCAGAGGGGANGRAGTPMSGANSAQAAGAKGEEHVALVALANKEQQQQQQQQRAPLDGAVETKVF